MLTSGRCIADATECTDTRFVFNYYRPEAGNLKTVTAADVFSCASIVVREVRTVNGQEVDYVVVRLDRPATPRFTPAPCTWVYETRGHRLVGILSDGHQGYADKGDCLVANVCKGAGCADKADTITYVYPAISALCEATQGQSARLCAHAFAPGAVWTEDYSNGKGWDQSPAHWQTIRFPDLNGDRKAGVCGRAVNGLFCALSTGAAFTPGTSPQR